MTPTLTRITVFPIKSLDGCDVTNAEVLPSGALKNDRRFALVDSSGGVINGKRLAAIHQIRASYNSNQSRVTLSSKENQQAFSLPEQQEELAAWCSDFLHFDCRLIENQEMGFPDDVESPGPTVLSQGSLQSVSEWYNQLTVEKTRRRLRANLEVSAEEPFWEDQLVGPPGGDRTFQIGPAVWKGEAICQRCVVPARNPETGETIAKFSKKFAANRIDTLPMWSPREHFDHYYRLGINTSLVSLASEDTIEIGDEVRPLEKIGS